MAWDRYAPVPVIAPVRVTYVTRKRIGWQRICPGCGETHFVKSSLKIYCSSRCRQRIYQARLVAAQRRNELEKIDRELRAAPKRVRALGRDKPRPCQPWDAALPVQPHPQSESD